MAPLQTNLFINNSYVSSSTGETLTIYSPTDDSLVSDQVQVASEADVDRAVAAARAAFPAWRDTAGHKRAKCMFKFAELLEREAGRLAELGRFFVSVCDLMSRREL
jgi:aldehyde dehydrogenase (NAD+)